MGKLGNLPGIRHIHAVEYLLYDSGFDSLSWTSNTTGLGCYTTQQQYCSIRHIQESSQASERDT